MSQYYQVTLPHFIAGGDCLGELQTIVDRCRAKRVFLVTDKGVRTAGLVDEALALLEGAGADVTVNDSIPPEPTYDQAQAVADASAEADLIVALGGGSVMDTAKLCSLLSGGETTVKTLLSAPLSADKRVPSVLIPTTCGTGSEATGNAIVAVPEDAVKVGIVNPRMISDFVLLCPKLLARLPKSILAATGVDALAHAVECFTSNKANPISDAFAAYSAKLIFQNIEKAYLEPDNMQAKEAMLVGAFFGGAAIAASGTTAVHALSYPLGGAFHIPHGISNAILFEPVMRFNADVLGERFRALADAVAEGERPQDSTEYIISAIARIVQAVEIPKSLKPFGVKPSDLDALTNAAFGVKRLLNNNAKPMTPEDIRAIYWQLL